MRQTITLIVIIIITTMNSNLFHDKNTNTLNALVGITPSGSVCFISDLLGGCISDKKITSNLVPLTNYSNEMRSWQIAGPTFKKCWPQKVSR